MGYNKHRIKGMMKVPIKGGIYIELANLAGYNGHPPRGYSFM